MTHDTMIFWDRAFAIKRKWEIERTKIITNSPKRGTKRAILRLISDPLAVSQGLHECLIFGKIHVVVRGKVPRHRT